MVREGTAVLIAILSLVSFICVASNLLVCLAIRFKRTISSPARYYIFSLAVADLIVGAVVVPFYAWLVARWETLNNTERKYYGLAFELVDSGFAFLSILHLCILSVDRAIAAVKPLHHRRFATRRTALKMLMLPWIIIFILAIPYIVLKRTALLYVIYFLTQTVLFYLVPVVLISICYALIFQKVRQRNRSRLNTERLNDMKLTRTVMAVIIAFIVCWTPFVCVSGYILITEYITGKRPVETWWHIVIKLVSFLNFTINPYIYTIFHSQFRRAFKDVIGVCKAEDSADT